MSTTKPKTVDVELEAKRVASLCDDAEVAWVREHHNEAQPGTFELDVEDPSLLSSEVFDFAEERGFRVANIRPAGRVVFDLRT